MGITNGYITKGEAQDYVGTQAGSNVSLLEETVEAVSRAIDAYCNRHFYQVEEVRAFDPVDGRFVTLGPFNDLVAATSVSASAAAVDTTGYQLLPVNRSGPEQRPYTAIARVGGSWPSAVDRAGSVEIDGTWGWPAVPAAVKQACRIQVSRVFKRAESPLGVAGFGEMGVVRITQLDPDVKTLLAPYRIVAGFA